MSTQATEGDDDARVDTIDLEGDATLLDSSELVEDGETLDGATGLQEEGFPFETEHAPGPDERGSRSTVGIATRRGVADSSSLDDTQSIPDDTPSIQVCFIMEIMEPKHRTDCSGFCSVFPGQ